MATTILPTFDGSKDPDVYQAILEVIEKLKFTGQPISIHNIRHNLKGNLPSGTSSVKLKDIQNVLRGQGLLTPPPTPSQLNRMRSVQPPSQPQQPVTPPPAPKQQSPVQPASNPKPSPVQPPKILLNPSPSMGNVPVPVKPPPGPSMSNVPAHPTGPAAASPPAQPTQSQKAKQGGFWSDFYEGLVHGKGVRAPGQQGGGNLEMSKAVKDFADAVRDFKQTVQSMGGASTQTGPRPYQPPPGAMPVGSPSVPGAKPPGQAVPPIRSGSAGNFLGQVARALIYS